MPGFYTRRMVEYALRRIDPEAFDIYKDKARLGLSDLIREMFVIGFQKALVYPKSLPFGSDADLLMRAYYQITVDPGYFIFED